MYGNSKGIAGWRKISTFFRKIIVSILVPVLLFETVGCGRQSGGEKSQSVPELMEPVSRSDSVCVVTKGSIGIPKILFASVVPEETKYSYETSVKLDKILVNVGDEVKKGDVLAKLDLVEAREQLCEVRKEYEKQKRIFQLNDQIALNQIKKLQLEKKKMKNKKELDEQIAVSRENMRYESLINERKLRSLKKEIKQREKNIKKGTLKSKGEGIVSYIKDLSDSMLEEDATDGAGFLKENALDQISEGALANAGETVVSVCSDLRKNMKHACLEVSDMTLGEYKFSNYEKKVLCDGDREYPLIEVSYPEKERLLFAARKEYPKMRFECSEKMKRELKPGETYPLYFYKKKQKDMLLIPNAALIGGNSVYVKTDGNSRERREIEPGETDGCMTQVRSGLSEGEAVYCQYAGGIPSMEDKQRVAVEDFTLSGKSRSVQASETVLHTCFSECSGRILRVNVKRGDKVKKGDVLYTVDTGAGKAHLTELAYRIQKEKRAFARQQKTYKKESRGEMSRCEREILDCEFELEKMSHEETLSELQEEYRKARSGSHATGEVDVCADRSGTVRWCTVEKGDTIESGQYSIVLRIKRKTGLTVKKARDSEEEQILGRFCPVVGAEVMLERDGQERSGICAGVSEDGTVYYVKALSEEKALSESLPDKRLQSSFSYINLHQVVIIPESMLHEENGGTGFYVWRVTESGAVKQSVVVQSGLAAERQNRRVVFYGLKEGDMIC